MTFIKRTFHEPAGLVYHGLAISYAIVGYGAGLAGLFHEHWAVNLIATLLLGHSMTIAAYLIHECGHNTIFRRNKPNARLGEVLNWICGAAYGRYEDIRYKHFRHHVDNDDSVWFEYPVFFEKHPLVLKIIQLLEWFYIPAHDIIMHAIMVFTSFIIPQRRNQRVRNVLMILVRGGLFFTALALAPKAALLYMVAYMIMIHILRFADGLQHDYASNPILFEEKPESRFGGRKTEQSHTFSNPVSLKYEKLNWFFLNFGFHNAHHARPTVPWYQLPAYHREQFGNDPERVIPFPAQVHMYHKYRVARITHSGGDFDEFQDVWGEDYLAACRAGRVYGGNAVSFLMSF